MRDIEIERKKKVIRGILILRIKFIKRGEKKNKKKTKIRSKYVMKMVPNHQTAVLVNLAGLPLCHITLKTKKIQKLNENKINYKQN